MELNKYNELTRKCLKVSESIEEIRTGMLKLGFTDEELWQD